MEELPEGATSQSRHPAGVQQAPAFSAEQSLLFGHQNKQQDFGKSWPPNQLSLPQCKGDNNWVETGLCLKSDFCLAVEIGTEQTQNQDP